MDRIAELMGRLSELTGDELNELESLIYDTYDGLKSSETLTPDQVAQEVTLADHGETVAAEKARRVTEAEELAAQRQANDARMEALRKPPEDKPAEGEGDDGAKAAADAEAKKAAEADAKTADAKPAEGADTPAESAPEVLPIAASAAPRGSTETQIQAMNRVAGRAQPSPEANLRPAYGVTIVAAAGLPSANPGQPFTSREELAKAMSEQLRTAKMTRDFTPHRVAHAEWEYPEERRLGPNAELNSQRLEAVCGRNAPRQTEMKRMGALVATGGICLPVNVDYAVPTWAVADRPLRDGLPSFQADRGGLRFVTPPDIGVSVLQGGTASGAGLATGIWTEATDANPAGATKPVWIVNCGNEVVVEVNAIPTRVGFGNMQSKFAPEQVAANTDMAMAQAARTAELELLTLMYNASVQVKPHQYLGATRDLLATIDLLKAGYIYSHRFGENVTLTVVWPMWAKSVIRADIARELAHDTDGRDPLAVTDAQIDAFFAMRGVNVIWTLDGLQSGTYGTGGSALANQYFTTWTAQVTANSGNAIQPQWPNQSSDGSFVLGGLLYVEGTYQHLDSGELNLGVVRDSLLDSTNDYETFTEVFEGIAFRGIEAVQIQSTILPSGGSAWTVASTSYHE